MKSIEVVRIVILIMNPGWKRNCGILFTDDERNDVRICVISMNQETIITYILYLYKFYHNAYNKYKFLMSSADIARNNVRICAIWIDLEKTIIYMTELYKFKWI